MTALRSPSLLAVVAASLAVLVYPGLKAAAWFPWHDVVVTTLALLLVLALLARAGTGADRLVATGALLALGAVGFDAVRGRTGDVLLVPGVGVRSFSETGPGGRVIGRRPFGFELRHEGATQAGGVAVAVGGEDDSGHFEVEPDRPGVWGGYRFGRPRIITVPLGGAEPGQGVRVDVTRQPAAPVAAAGIVLAVLGVALGLRRP